MKMPGLTVLLQRGSNVNDPKRGMWRAFVVQGGKQGKGMLSSNQFSNIESAKQTVSAKLYPLDVAEWKVEGE